MGRREVTDLIELINGIEESREKSGKSNFIVGISGIDASGKGYVSKLIREKLQEKGKSVHLENLDGWLNKPDIRFSKESPAETFYKNGFRFKEIEEMLLSPYKNYGKIDIEADYIEETWQEYRKKKIKIEEAEIFILEGIFLFKEERFPQIDYKIWIECSFETALERALLRNQEGMDGALIKKAYESIYFPAQKIHFEIDTPYDKADIVYINNKK